MAIPLCLSKILANDDEIALREGHKPSLSGRSPCYGCSGQNLHCRNYSNPAVKEEDKKRLQHELIFGSGRYVLFDSENC